MMFYPINFFGLRPFGWQGIVPRNAATMANEAVDLMTEKLLDIKEIFSNIDPKIVARNLQPSLKKISKQIIDEVMYAQAPIIWKKLSIQKKKKLYEKVEKILPEIFEMTMIDIKTEIKELIDFKKLTIDALIDDKTLINRMFLNIGSNEFRFIENSGLFFGLFFGLIQMVVIMYFNDWWIFIIGGIFVGFLTNFLALQMIFKPVNPIKLFRIKIQGLFLKRQKEVAKEYSSIVTKNIITIEQLFDALFKTSTDGKIQRIISKNITVLVDKIFGYSIDIFQKVFKSKKIDIIINIATYRFMQEIPIAMTNTYEYAAEVLELQKTIEEKMSNLASKDFISFLRPIFKQDEWKLILAGAWLGGIAGIIQFILFIFM